MIPLSYHKCLQDVTIDCCLIRCCTSPSSQQILSCRDDASSLCDTYPAQGCHGIRNVHPNKQLRLIHFSWAGSDLLSDQPVISWSIISFAWKHKQPIHFSLPPMNGLQIPTRLPLELVIVSASFVYYIQIILKRVCCIVPFLS